MAGKARSVAHRYRSLISAITGFVVLFTLILLVNIYASVRIERANQTMIEANAMQTNIQAIIKELYNLKLHYGEAPNTPMVRTSLQTLRNSQQSLNERLQLFIRGGVLYTDRDGKVQIDALRGGELGDAVVRLQENWGPINQLLIRYLDNAQSIRSDETALDLAVMDAQEKSRILTHDAGTVASIVRQRATNTATLMRGVQLAAIAAAVIYLVFFLRVFIRRLLVADRRAAQAQDEINEIMGTVSSGLFLIDRDLSIGSQHSAELEKILGRKEIGGLSLPQLLQDLVDAESLQMTHSFVKQLYNSRVREKLIADLNPLSRIAVQVPDASGQLVDKYLDFRFNRVYEGKEIVRVLASVVDSTSAVRLQERLEREQAQNNAQLQMLGSMIEAEPSVMEDFVAKVNQYSHQINQALKDPNNSQSALRYKANSIFREIHTIKGEASALRLSSFVDLANEFENHLNTLKKQEKLSGEDFLPLVVQLEKLLTLTATINDLSSKVDRAGMGQHAVAALPVSVQFKQHLEQFAADLAARNGKQVGLSFGNLSVLDRLAADRVSAVREMVVQLLRNAVVHGIERPEERVAKGKLSVGHIHIHCEDQGTHFHFTVEDDGIGIDYERVRAKVSESEGPLVAANLSQEQLNRYLFSSGFSTLQESHEDAGRGVGLDAVKNTIKALGGKVRLLSANGVFTRFVFKFPY